MKARFASQIIEEFKHGRFFLGKTLNRSQDPILA